jgi:hypothetical protein
MTLRGESEILGKKPFIVWVDEYGAIVDIF